MAERDYSIKIVGGYDNTPVRRAVREQTQLLDRAERDELSRTRRLSTSRLRELQRSNREQAREYERSARDASRVYERELGRGFFARLGRGAADGFKSTFKVGGGGGIGGGGILGGAASVLTGNILTSVLGGVTSQLTGGLKAGFDYNKLKEQTLLGFEIKLKGREEAERFFRQIEAFAEKAPMGLDAALESTQQLMSAFTAPQALQSLKAITDAVAYQGKVGGEAAERINGIGLALQQILFKNKLQAEELVQLQERQLDPLKYIAAGVAAVDAEFARLTSDEQSALVSEMITKGMINARAAVAAIIQGLEKDFGGTAEKIATRTAAGLESNISDSLNRTAGIASESAFEQYKKFLLKTNEFLQTGAAEKIAGGISASSGALFGALEKTLGAVQSGSIQQLGLDVPLGYATGIMQGIPQAAEAGANMVGATLKAVVDTQKSNSPSLLFKEQGMFAAMGYGEGFFQAWQGQAQSIREQIEALAKDPRIKAWFEVIRQVEGGGPDVMVGRGRVQSGRRHPGEVVPRSQWYVGQKGPSSAAGNWQITVSNWKKLAPILGLDNFSDVNQQMMAALALFMEGGGPGALLSGDTRGALRASAPWAATPLSHLPGRKPLSSEMFVGRYQQLLSGQSPAGASVQNPVPVRIVGGDGAAAQMFGAVSPHQEAELKRLIREKEDFVAETVRKRTLNSQSEQWALQRMREVGFGADAFDERKQLKSIALGSRRAIEELDRQAAEFIRDIDARIAAARARVNQGRLSPETPLGVTDEQARGVLEIMNGVRGAAVEMNQEAVTLATEVAPQALASVKIIAEETGDSFAGIPHIINQSAKDSKKQMEELARDVSGMFGGLLGSAVRGQWRDGLRGLRDDFLSWATGLAQDWFQSRLFKALTSKSGTGAGAGGGGFLGSLWGGLKGLLGIGRGASATTPSFTGAAIPGLGGSVFGMPGASPFGGSFGGSVGGKFSNFFDMGLTSPLTTEQAATQAATQSVIRGAAKGATGAATGAASGAAAAGAFSLSGLGAAFAPMAPLLGLQLGAQLSGGGLGSLAGGLGGLALGGAGAVALLGGAGAPIFAAGGGLASLGSTATFLTNPFTLAIAGGLLAAGLISGVSARRRKEEQARDQISNDTGSRIWALIARARELTPAEADAEWQSIANDYRQGISQLSGKTRKIAEKTWTEHFLPLKKIVDIRVKEGEEARRISERLIPAFAGGNLVARGDGGALSNFSRMAAERAGVQFNPQGLIRGPGGPTSDSVFAYFPTAGKLGRVSASEYVIDAETVRAVGVERLDRLRATKGRSADAEGFADGGSVEPIAAPVRARQSLAQRLAGANFSLTVHNHGDRGAEAILDIEDPETAEKIVLTALQHSSKVRRLVGKSGLQTVKSAFYYREGGLHYR